MRGLLGRELAVFDAIGDAPLLVGLAPIYLIDARVAGINLSRACAGGVAVLGLSSGGSDEHQTTHCHDEEGLREFAGHVRENPCDEV